MSEQLDLDHLDSFEYEERADYLPENLLLNWSPQNNKHFNYVQTKLTQVGAKLLIGPRGAGKTHYMRHAYITCRKNESYPLPIYVSFNHYLRLETYLHEESNAIDIFHAWVLAKIVIACHTEYDVFPSEVSFSISNIEDFISDIEKQQYKSEHDAIINELKISGVQSLIEICISKNKRKRAVLFFDDAALTLTKEYMVEFFDVFRSIKTARISPKASVYPGTTQYGPRFHLGQDAEPVSIWQDVEQPEYLDFMLDLVRDRFNALVDVDDDIKTLLIYSSFGIPRAYINLVRAYVESKKKNKQSKFNEIIDNRCRYLQDEYRSIIDKLPQYVTYVNIGWQLFSSFVSELKELNHANLRRKDVDFKKTVTVGVEDISDEKIERVISFLVEAGLIYETSSISHGVDRKLRRFIPHYAYLIKERVFSVDKGFSAAILAQRIGSQSEKHPLRKKITRFLSHEAIESIALTLPSCVECGSRRLSDSQKFCHMCGSRLIDESAFRTCMRKSLLELPLSDFQKKVINQTKFKTVEDVISSKNTASELMKVKQVAQKRASVIEQKVRSWVNEFLE